MELQVLTRKENLLLKRVEITFRAVHKAEPTPTRDALRSELAKQLQAAKDTVIVARSASSFGRYETRGYAKIYKSKEEALSIERSHILVRNKLKEAEVKKEGEKAEKPPKAAKPAPKAEAPKAEPKPEHKAEAKAEHKEEKPAAKEEKKPGEKHEEKKEPKPEAKKAEPKKKEGR
jgi:small subunit ribosomal protein S24e